MGIYEYAAINMLERFDAHVEGAPDSTLMIVSFERLGDAARKALGASADLLGYGHAGINWVTLFASNVSSVQSELSGESFRMLIEGLDPIAIVATDAIAAGMLVNAYNATGSSAGGMEGGAVSDAAVGMEGGAAGDAAGGAAGGAAHSAAHSAAAQTNSIARIAGRSVVLLEDFEAALADDNSKQRAWHLLKKLSR